jgi:hypothetical protein
MSRGLYASACLPLISGLLFCCFAVLKLTRSLLHLDRLSRGQMMRLWSCFKRERYDITALVPALSPKLRHNTRKSIAKLQPHKVPLPVHHGRHGQDEHASVAASLCGGGGKYGKIHPLSALAVQHDGLAQSSRVRKRSSATL